MIQTILSALCALLLLPELVSQRYTAAGTFTVTESYVEAVLAGFRKPAPNPLFPAMTPQDEILCRVTGPASASPGTSIMAPVAPYAAGWPVLVFFPGFDMDPVAYDEAAAYMASFGYIVVVVDSNDNTLAAMTAAAHPFPVHVVMDLNEATVNGIMLEDVLQRATLQTRNAGVLTTSAINGKFDKTKIACGGHSLGGGLAHSLTGPLPGGNLWAPYGTPDYVARVTWAPWGGSGTSATLGTGGHYKMSGVAQHKGAESALPGLIIVGDDDNGSDPGTPAAFTEDAWDWYAKLEASDNYTDQNMIVEVSYDPADQATLKVGHNEVLYSSPNTGGAKVFVSSMLAAYGYLEAQLFDENLWLGNTVGPAAKANPCVKKVAARFKQVRACQYGDAASMPSQPRTFVTYQDVSSSVAPNPIGGAWCYIDGPALLPAPIPVVGGVGEWWLAAPSSLGAPYSYDHRQTHGAMIGWPYVQTPALFHPNLGVAIYAQIIATVKPVAPNSYTNGVSNVFAFTY